MSGALNQVVTKGSPPREAYPSRHRARHALCRRHDMAHDNSAAIAASRLGWLHNRWFQLAIGVVCMGLVANLQYGWTLFVTPMNAKHHWGESAIQVAFSIFIVTETWLVPLEGWLVDKIGPRPVVA